MLEERFPFEQVYHNYLQVERELVEDTVKKYLSEVQKFMQWLQTEYGLEQVEPEKVTIFQLRGYLSYLKNELGNKPTTRNLKVSVLQSYYHFLVLIECLEEEDNITLYIRKAKESKPLPVYLTLDESKALLEASVRNTCMPKRDYAMMRFFLTTACRMAEFLGFNLDNLDLEDNSVRLLGKGNKERIVPLTKKTRMALLEYLQVRKPSTKGERVVFLNDRGMPFSGYEVRQLFKKICADAGLVKPNLSPIKLRHTCLTLLLKEGVDLVVLKEIAGHESIKTTRRYTHVTQNDLRQAVNKYPFG